MVLLFWITTGPELWIRPWWRPRASLTASHIAFNRCSNPLLSFKLATAAPPQPQLLFPEVKDDFDSSLVRFDWLRDFAPLLSATHPSIHPSIQPSISCLPPSPSPLPHFDVWCSSLILLAPAASTSYPETIISTTATTIIVIVMKILHLAVMPKNAFLEFPGNNSDEYMTIHWMDFATLDDVIRWHLS